MASESLVAAAGRRRVGPVPSNLRRTLLAWYRRARRDLPWRRKPDPYGIWVSEVMLQQTQVATVVPYYQRFMARFPSVASLARARTAEVLAIWSGLGYYRRARHLHAAARIVMREHAGRIPRDPDVFGRLPGVGRYTTGAVLSMGFDTPLAVLDGNVARVLSRLLGVRASVRETRGARTLWQLAESLVPRHGAGDWNQAVMELGATVCTPRDPLCHGCPVSRSCRARREGRVYAYPPIRPRRRAQRVERAIVLIEQGGRWLMTPRVGPLLGGLWEPPGIECDGMSTATTRRALHRSLATLGLDARLQRSDVRVRHKLTHRDFQVSVWRGTLHGTGRPAGGRFIDPRRPARPVSGLVRRVLKALQ